MGKWVMDIIIGLFVWIDKVIVNINNLLFELFIEVAEGRVKSEFFETLINNLYIIVGIFVLFRVAFSLIQMLANPDMMSDKEKGAGKLATRVVVSFALIVMIPTIFDYAYDLQSAVLQDNLIGRLILGDSEPNASSPNASSNNAGIQSQGALMSINIFKSMADPGKDKVVANMTDDGEKKCVAALRDDDYSTIDSLENVDGDTNCFKYQYDNKYVYDYKIIVSSLTLGMVAWLMVGFCIDIGVRLIKLTFLQLIAPVCIVSYIGGGKENSFGKWTKMTVSAYVSLFVKLIVIYFIVYFASKVTDSIEGITSGLGTVLIYLGLLVFAKNATNLIGDLFGIKMDQESGFKGIAKTALLGAAGLAAGGGLGGISSAISQYGASRQAGNGFGKALLAGTGGLFGGAVAGAASGAKSKNPFKAGTNALNISQKRGQQTFNKGTTGWWERTGAKVTSGLGMQTTGQKMKSRLDALNQYAKGRESIKAIAEGDKNNRSYLAAIGGTGYTKVNDFKEAYERAVNSGMSESEIMLRKQQWDDATNMAIDHDMRDSTTSIGAISANMDRLMSENSETFQGMSHATNASELGANYGEVKNRSTVLEQSAEYQRATQVDNAINKGNK
ncbi:MAG: hypothetical protein E7166_05040 [Firmicutes bacterium]|nr:hypothetical protein [Bacillota bacterium]